MKRQQEYLAAIEALPSPSPALRRYIENVKLSDAVSAEDPTTPGSLERYAAHWEEGQRLFEALTQDERDTLRAIANGQRS